MATSATSCVKRANVANDEERIQPRRHEEEIQEPRGEYKGPDEPPDLALLLKAGDQGDQVDQHPHGTRIEPVRETHERRERQQGMAGWVDFAK